MSFLYVTERGATINLSGGNLVVNVHDEKKEDIPKETVDAILIFGNSQLTTQAMQFCLNKGINVSFFSETGKYYGQLSSENSIDVVRLRKQMDITSDKSFCLEFAKRIISAKINNQIVLLRRYLRGSGLEKSLTVKPLRIAKNKINECDDIAKVMGYEGIASKTYFEVIGELLPSEYEFKGRNRRPSKDPINAMLNLGYSMLYHELIGVINSRGLCAYAGFMHQDKAGHATLASDLMEEWRPVIVDSTVLSLVRGKEISLNHFQYDGDECKLTHDGIKIFVAKLERKMYTEMQYIGKIDKAIDFRKALFHQVLSVTKMVDSGRIEEYKPIIIR